MDKSLTDLLKPIHFRLKDFGLDFRRMLSVRNAARYASQYHRFKKLGGVITGSVPILYDYQDQAGSASGHYFHQDLLVASFVHQHNPARHIDIGSRIDGFVAHVAAFRKIEVMDIRRLDNTGHENISFVKADLMDDSGLQDGTTDSISCLHAIEHFGLGRYGDSLDPRGHIKGFSNILRMLKVGGMLYISFPIENQNVVRFNAYRAFHPNDIFSWLRDPGSLSLERFDYVDGAGNLHQRVDVKYTSFDASDGCGIYTFKKIR